MHRFTDIETTSQKLTPISGYLNYPLLPLQKALEPVFSEVSQLDQFGRTADKKCHFPSEHGLTRDESAAVFLYSMEWGEHSFYRMINRALRVEDRSTLKPWFGYLKLFDTAMRKLATVRQNLWRGITRDISKNYKKDDEFTWWAISSCSTSVDVIKDFLGPNSTLFLIEAVNGKDLSKYTNYPNENEVILCPGTRFRVVSDPLDKPPMHLVHLKELSNENEITPTQPLSIPAAVHVLKAAEEFKSSILHTAEIKIDTDRFGNRYEGEMKNNKKHGKGKMNFVNGNSYDGMWVHDSRTGQGVFTWSNGDRYEGQFKDNKEHGKGTFIWGPYEKWAGDIYKGDWVDGKRTGQGTYTFSNGNRYEGQFQDDRQHGKGTMTWASNADGSYDKYTGDYVNNVRTGYGVFNFANGDQYEGQFKDNKKHGRGRMQFVNGDQYDGDWVDDDMSGLGTYTFAKGKRYEGQWENGEMHGKGTIFYTNGKIREGVWCDGQQIC